MALSGRAPSLARAITNARALSRSLPSSDQLHPRSDRSSPESDLSWHDPAIWQEGGESERTDARAGPLSSQTCDFAQ